MLDLDQVADLQAVVDPPAVTLLLRNDLPDRSARLDALIAEAEARLSLELETAEVTARIRRLVELAETVDEDRGQQAIALFASAGHAAASRLPEAVSDRVVVDDTFATRDLVRAHLRSPSYLALVLGDPGARLFRGRGRVLWELVDTWFPVVDRDPETTERGRRHDPGIERDRRRARLVREIDLGLEGPLREVAGPLFVLGPRERVTGFVSASRHAKAVAGDVPRGLPRHVSPGVVSTLVWPEIETWLAGRQAAAVEEVESAAGARRLATGVDEIWPLARDGRGDLLVVEEGFALTVRVDGDRLDVAEDATTPGVVDDIVDEVIEAVMTQGGRVVIVADRALEQRGRIAMKLRY